MSPTSHPKGTGQHEGLGPRLAALERAFTAMAAEIRTRRMVVVDASGSERIIGETRHGTAELRVENPGGNQEGGESAVAIFASPVTTGPDPGGTGLGPAVGIHLLAEGDAVAELEAWPGRDGRWCPHLHLTDDAT